MALNGYGAGERLGMHTVARTGKYDIGQLPDRRGKLPAQGRRGLAGIALISADAYLVWSTGRQEPTEVTAL